MIPLKFAVLCMGCEHVSDSRTDTCEHCGERGNFLALARVLNPTIENGQISYIHAGGNA